MHFYPSLETPQFHYRIATKNPKQKLGIAEKILREILLVSNFDYRNPDFSLLNFYDTKQYVYRNTRFDVAYELGLCNWLGRDCLYELIQRLHEWSQKTYEGKHVAFSFLIDSSQKSIGNINYIEFLKNKHSAVFTDGISSGIKLDYKGNIIKYFSTTQEHIKNNHTTWAPYEFINFADLCVSEWIGVILQNNSDMLIFKNKQLVFAKRNGKWIYLNSYTMQSTIGQFYTTRSNDSNKKEFADEIYSSVLDASFAHTGGCIAIVKDEYCEYVQKNHFPNDTLSTNNQKNEKKTIIQRFIDTESTEHIRQNFQHLDDENNNEVDPSNNELISKDGQNENEQNNIRKIYFFY